MKVLLDACVWGGVRDALRAEFHDVEWAGDWSTDPGDEEILSLAYRQNRILITLDKDFGGLAVIHGQLHAGIIRLVDIRARRQGLFSLYALNRYGQELQEGAIVTIHRDRARIRSPHKG